MYWIIVLHFATGHLRPLDESPMSSAEQCEIARDVVQKRMDIERKLHPAEFPYAVRVECVQRSIDLPRNQGGSIHPAKWV